MSFTLRVKSGKHIHRDEEGNRVPITKGQTFETSKPLHRGIFADKFELLNDSGEAVTDVKGKLEQDPIPSEEAVLSDDDLTLDKLEKMTLAQLRQQAEDMELDTSSCSKKADYVDLIFEAMD